MGQMPRFRPVSVTSRSDQPEPSAAAIDHGQQATATAPTSRDRADWPPEALELAVALHQSLKLGDREWHALKHQKGRRGAEQIAAALVQLLHDPKGAVGGQPERREQVIALLEHGLAWLRGDLKDPGCPTHGR